MICVFLEHSGYALNFPGSAKLVRLDGQVVNVEVASIPIPYQDSSASLAVIRDITERLEMRTALRAAKEAAESANLAKSQFLANMSH